MSCFSAVCRAGSRLLPAIALLLLTAAACPASTWGGHNGVIRLSFTPGGDWNAAAAAPASRQAGLKAATPAAGADSLQGGRGGAVLSAPQVVRSTAGDSLVVAATLVGRPQGAVVDVYAVLDGVTLVHWNGLQLRALGGLEFALRIEGGEASVVGQDFPLRTLNVANEPGRVSAGVVPELPLRDGRATLVHWRVLVPGDARHLVFRLDPTAASTCGTLDGCPESGTQAVWTGSASSDMAGLVFSAGYTPAYLNWDGRPDLSEVRGKVDWSDTGLFTRE